MRDLIEMWNDDLIGKCIVTTIAMMVLFLAFIFIDPVFGHSETVTGTIHELHFEHGNQSTNVGMAFTSKGAAPVIMSSGHPDEWSMIVKIDNHYTKVNCNTDQYYGHDIGQTVSIKIRYGLTGGIWFKSLVK